MYRKAQLRTWHHATSGARGGEGGAGEEPGRRAAAARGDQAALPAAPQEHRAVPRIALRGGILQDHHGTGKCRNV